MQYAEEPLVRRYDDPRLFGTVVEDTQLNLRCRYFSPAYHPKEWRTYLDAAEESYARHGVANAVRRRELEIDPCPSFWMIEDRDSDQLLGGMRNHGPYPSVDEIWGMQEMRAHERYQDLVRVVEPLIPRGVMENKGVFVHSSVASDRAKVVVEMLLRLQTVSIDLIGACALIGTSAKHTMSMWRRGGCEAIFPHISVPYPNENYSTVLVAHLVSQRDRLMDPELRFKAAEDLFYIRESLIALEAV